MADPKQTRKRWLQFGLRTLLVATFSSSLLFGWIAKERRRGKFVTQFTKAGKISFEQSPGLSPRSILKKILGDQIAGDIVSLDLEYAHITDADMEGVALVTEAKFLDIIDNPVTDQGLVNVRYLRQLQELYIGGQYARQITDDGLLRFGRLRRLRVLELRQTGVRGSGLNILSKLPALESISLWDSDVDDSAIVHLKKLTNLKRLVVGRTQMSQQGIEELRKSLPNCLVIDDT